MATAAQLAALIGKKNEAAYRKIAEQSLAVSKVADLRIGELGRQVAGMTDISKLIDPAVFSVGAQMQEALASSYLTSLDFQVMEIAQRAMASFDAIAWQEESEMRNLPLATLNEIMRSSDRLRIAMEGIHAVIPPSLLKSIAEQMATYHRMAEEREEEERLLAPFIGNGLCLAPSIPQELIDECVRRHEAGESVLDCVLTWSRGDEWTVIKSMVESWKSNPFLAARSEITHEALLAHTDGRFAASVALLVGQPEGIVLDWVYASDAMDEVKKEKSALPRKRVRAEREHKELLELTEELGYSADDLLVAFARCYVTMIPGMLLPASMFNQRQWASMHSFVQFGSKVLYRPYKLFKDHDAYMDSDILNRHAIAHGSALRSGTEINSLRLFLALDVLALVHE